MWISSLSLSLMVGLRMGDGLVARILILGWWLDRREKG
jgi:hypothetical protein